MEEVQDRVKEDGLIDIIVPVYNQENLVNRCIESVRDQTYKNWNLILVDDGSTDRSGEICSSYQKKDTRITYIHKENGGVSSARNEGLKFAKGSNCIFLDADDYIEGNYIELLLGEMGNFDLILTGNFYIDGKGEIKTRNEPTISDAIGKVNMAAYIFTKQCFKYFTTPWGKLFKRSIINDCKLVFRDIDYGEDMCFVFDYLSHSSGFKVVNGTHYFYLHSGYSLSRRPIENIWTKLKDINGYSMKSFYKKYDEIWNYMFFRIIKVALMNDLGKHKEWRNVLRQIKKDDDYKKLEMNKIGDLSDRLMYILLNYFPSEISYLFLKLYSGLWREK